MLIYRKNSNNYRLIINNCGWLKIIKFRELNFRKLSKWQIYSSFNTFLKSVERIARLTINQLNWITLHIHSTRTQISIHFWIPAGNVLNFTDWSLMNLIDLFFLFYYINTRTCVRSPRILYRVTSFLPAATANSCCTFHERGSREFAKHGEPRFRSVLETILLPCRLLSNNRWQP